MKRSIWLSMLLSPLVMSMVFAQDPTANDSITNNFYGPVTIIQGGSSASEQEPASPAQEAPKPAPPVQENPKAQQPAPVFTPVAKPRPKNPSLTLGVKGSYFKDRDHLTSDVGRYNWVVAPGHEFGVFADFYLNRFIVSTIELMYARDLGYVSSGETITANSVSFNALFKLRAPITPRFALTGGVGLFTSIGTVSTGSKSETMYMRGLLTEFAVETSLGDRNQHVFTVGMRHKVRFNDLNWDSIKQQPIGIMGSYGYRW